jgi:hypothetical protein
MLPQLVGLFSVERAGVKLEMFFESFADVSDASMLGNLYFSDSHYIEASILASECLK